MKMEIVKINERTREDITEGRKYVLTEYTIGNYKVEHLVTCFNGNVEPSININVSLNWEDHHENYLPEIYFNDMWFKPKKDRYYFSIQTTSYGSFRPDDIKKIIAGYQQAVEVVEVLTEKFITKGE